MPSVDSLDVSAYVIPTAQPESDGTLTWESTCVVIVEVTSAGARGLGFTYATPACARLIDDVLRPAVLASDAMDVTGAWSSMARSIRNMGRPGISSMSIAAVDCALWDLKARLLSVPLASLLGHVRQEVPLYGSGGFTSLTSRQLDQQLTTWVEDQGMTRVKIKVAEAWGTRIERDVERVAQARRIIGDQCELFVDANGGYGVKQAVRIGSQFADFGVTWFEEPVSSDHLEGLAQVRSAVPMDVTAGEYGYDLFYFEAMCESGAVDCLQADVSRCAGITEWMRVAAVAESHGLEVSGHCAQSLHVHPAAAVHNLRHLEYFADHERVDRLLFDGVLEPRGGSLRPDLSRVGNGLDLKRRDAERYRVL
ncbi:MAG TPA: enolase C-terminal domain-like protein [Acidimicrobiales bacterium]|nr:enolase C-terminal domain-like protein [Acidimicrobiales bacterium]